MTWMAKWAGGFPIFLDRAVGSRVTDVDGHTYVDFALGDTGAMAGHSPPATVAAVQRRLGELGGITAMLPTEDAAWVAGELTNRFGLPRWSFALSATDANRWALRLARLVTGRPLVACFAYSYHGTVDETFVVRATGRLHRRPGPATSRRRSIRPRTTRALEWNDLTSVEACAGRRAGRGAHHRAGPDEHRHRAPGARVPGRAAAGCATGPARCCSSTRPTRCRRGPGAARRRGGCGPTSSRWASRSPAASRSAPTACPPTSPTGSPLAVDAEGADLVDVGGVGGTLAGQRPVDGRRPSHARRGPHARRLRAG